jgi:hypothetical protein
MALWQRGTLGNQVLGEVAVELAPYASRGAFKFSEQLALNKRGGTDAKAGGGAAADGADGDDDAGACGVGPPLGRVRRLHVRERRPWGRHRVRRAQCAQRRYERAVGAHCQQYRDQPL